jgi:hypothetical protein
MGPVTNRSKPLPSRRGKVGNWGYRAVFFDIFNHGCECLRCTGNSQKYMREGKFLIFNKINSQMR